MRGNRPDLWERQLDFVADYYYLTCPWTSRFGLFLGTQRWVSRGEERQDTLIDETMGMHGSAWFMPTLYYRHHLQGLFTQDASLYGDGEEIPIDKFWPLPTSSHHHPGDKYLWPEK